MRAGSARPGRPRGPLDFPRSGVLHGAIASPLESHFRRNPG
ncbi:hypothetical protein APASM_3584 [Actinosynnema pretiosum subsp. pretiosum]|nr:hypothetical protein APASM_3584 [Actinosynnema pretiosum subsp. pretiosum]